MPRVTTWLSKEDLHGTCAQQICSQHQHGRRATASADKVTPRVDEQSSSYTSTGQHSDHLGLGRTAAWQMHQKACNQQDGRRDAAKGV